MNHRKRTQEIIGKLMAWTAIIGGIAYVITEYINPWLKQLLQ